MVVAIDKMSTKPTLKVSVSDSDSSDSASEGAEMDVEKSDSEVEEIDQHLKETKNRSTDAESDSNNSEDESSTLITNEGWADSVAKILGSSKPKSKKTLVLSRAKKYKETVKVKVEDKPSFEVIGDEEEKKDIKLEVKDDPDSQTSQIKKKDDSAHETEQHSQRNHTRIMRKKIGLLLQQERPNSFFIFRKIEKPSIRVKPNILEKDRERLLSKIATKGVVQLFNAVRNQQKSLDKEIDNNPSETKRDKILKKFDKRTFLDTLMGQTKSVIVDDNVKKLKDEVKKEEPPKWSALRDDFMTGAKMKDWDKESVDE